MGILFLGFLEPLLESRNVQCSLYLLWEVCHDVVEALPGEEVLVKFVLLSSHILREWLCPAQHLSSNNKL